MSLSYFELLRSLLPEAALVAGAMAVLAFDLIAGRGRSLADRTGGAAWIGSAAVFVALFGTLRIGTPGLVFGQALILDGLTQATRIGVLGLTLLTLLFAGGTVRLKNPAEYVAIILFAASGFTLMAAAQQLLVVFLAVELASLSLYVLVGFDKTRPDGAEAAVKYFLFGGMSAAFLLFGFSLLYGLTGSIELREISTQLAGARLTPLHVAAIVMVVVAFGFKAAAAPFHLWAPDAYQGAPSASAALIASASKLAGLVLFTRLFWAGLAPLAGSAVSTIGTPGWLPVLAIIAAVSLIVGNIAALAQTNVRRLLAYSAIAHAGALLLGVMAAGRSGPGPLFYYAATYGIATVGAFGVLAVVENSGGCQKITDLAGLHRRSPLLAMALLVFVLSLAGIPPLAGFFGKFAVFSAALQIGGLHAVAGWLALLAIGLSAVALYYYLAILKQALVVAPSREPTPITVPFGAGLALAAAVLLLVLLGVFPSLLLGLFAPSSSFS